MHTNKSAAPSQPLGILLPGSAGGKQRSAGSEPGASFATLFKSNREPAPAMPPANAPAPSTPAPQAAAAPKPQTAKPAAARPSAAAPEHATTDSGAADTTNAAATTDSQGRASARPGAKAAATTPAKPGLPGEPDAGAEARLDATRSDALPGQPASSEETAAAGPDEASDSAPAAVPTVALPGSAAAVLPPEQLAAQWQTSNRTAAPADSNPADASTLDGAAARGDRRIERGHGRPGENALNAMERSTAEGTAQLGPQAGTSSVGTSALPHPEPSALAGGDAAAPAGPVASADANVGTPLSFQQALGQAAQAQASGSPAGAPTAADSRSLPIHQDLHSPGFAPEMGARLSLLASEGVQSAQLLLNPAEMGPVAVQIVLDGQQAQISFHSDQAETRAVLERSLPDLAAALRENGLTLSGGGVFQQDAGTRQQQAADTPAQQARAQQRAAIGAPAEGEPLPAAPRRAAVARGVLDTYA